MREIEIVTGKGGVLLMKTLLVKQLGETLSKEEQHEITRKLIHGAYNISSITGYEFIGYEDEGEDGVYIIKQEGEYFLIRRKNNWVYDFKWIEDKIINEAKTMVKDHENIFLDCAGRGFNEYEKALISTISFMLSRNIYPIKKKEYEEWR